jgi:hypothetical protein
MHESLTCDQLRFRAHIVCAFILDSFGPALPADIRAQAITAVETALVNELPEGPRFEISDGLRIIEVIRRSIHEVDDAVHLWLKSQGMAPRHNPPSPDESSHDRPPTVTF